MDEFEEPWDTCAICNEIITVEQSPKFYWEEVREEITPYEALVHQNVSADLAARHFDKMGRASSYKDSKSATGACGTAFSTVITS
jgi:hypothetical protein